MNLIVPHGFEANYVLGFVKGLASNGVAFRVLSSDEIASRLDEAGITHRNIRGSQEPGRSRYKKALNLALYYLRLLTQVLKHRGSTIHFIGLLSSRLILLEGLILPLWFRLCAGTYIHTAHNALPHGRERSRLFAWAYRIIYRFPHRILVHSDEVARRLTKEFGVPPRKICQITIGLNHEVPASRLSVSEIRQRLGVVEAAPLVLFFGKIEPYKGLDLLLEAWADVRVPRARLLIAGMCPDRAYASRIREGIAALGADSGITWREGFIPNEDLGMLLTACDVAVLPYRHIYQSGVVFLCMRFGVPIIASQVGSMPEYVTPSNGLLVSPVEALSFARAIDDFFAHQDRFSRAEIAASSAKYEWAVQCRSILALY